MAASDTTVNASEIAFPRWLARLCLVAGVAAGVYGTGFWAFRDSGPPAGAFAGATDVIRKAYQEGDHILLVPFYATRAREYLGDLRPVAVRDPMLEDFSIHKRVWVFGLFGEAEKLEPRMRAAGHERIERKRPHPKITIDLYRVTNPATVVYSFRDNLRSARVFHEQRDGRKVACDKWLEKNAHDGPFGRWSCPKDAEWFYVSPEWHRMGDHLRLCLWAHPPNEGRLLISWPNVPMTGTLFGHGGHTLNGSLHARERIDLDVLVGNDQQRFTFPLEEHWRPFALNIPRSGTATVTFAVSTPDAGANHFCFTADVRREPQGAK